MFFQKTIQSCVRENFSLENALLEQLKNGGIRADFAQLNADSKGIYFNLPNKEVHKVLLYQAKIQEGAFRNFGDPQVHLCGCSGALKALDNSDFLAVIAYNLYFSLGIYANKAQTKIFHQKPLQICQECIKISGFDGDLMRFLGSGMS